MILLLIQKHWSHSSERLFCMHVQETLLHMLPTALSDKQ